jgi:hypothetical protein
VSIGNLRATRLLDIALLVRVPKLSTASGRIPPAMPIRGHLIRSSMSRGCLAQAVHAGASPLDR